MLYFTNTIVFLFLANSVDAASCGISFAKVRIEVPLVNRVNNDIARRKLREE